MDNQIESLLEKDKEAIRGLTAITQKKYIDLFDQIQKMDIPESKKIELFKKASADIAAPSFKLNEELSTNLFDMNRSLDVGSELNFDVYEVTGLSQESMSSSIAQTSWAVNDAGEKAWTEDAGKVALLLLIGGGLTKAFLNARSENYSKIGQRDGRFQKKKRVPGARACAYCISQALSDDGGAGKFHRNCRCSVGLFWDTSNPDKYQNDTLVKYEEDRAKVLAQLLKAGAPTTEDSIIKAMRATGGYR